jgi:hypothetical protein
MRRSAATNILMRLASAVAVLATGPLIACGAPRATPSSSCGPSFPAIPPDYPIKGRHEIRLGSVLDTSYASRSVARLVFHVRSTDGVDLGHVVRAYTVVLGDSVIKDLPPLGAVGDSTGVALLKAVPVAYTFAHVRRIGYRNHTVPLAVRPGYTDSVFVALPSGPVCILE